MCDNFHIKTHTESSNERETRFKASQFYSGLSKNHDMIYNNYKHLEKAIYDIQHKEHPHKTHIHAHLHIFTSYRCYF